MNAATDTLDLHGLRVAEAIERFVQQYNERVKKSPGGAWTIVHGYGSSGQGGAIRIKLRTFLDQHLDKLRYEPGDNYGNPGWTWVYPKTKLPDRQERLALEILRYCSTPRTEEKIFGEFILPSGMKARELVRSLVKQGKLKEVRKGIKLAYQAQASNCA